MDWVERNGGMQDGHFEQENSEIHESEESSVANGFHANGLWLQRLLDE